MHHTVNIQDCDTLHILNIQIRNLISPEIVMYERKQLLILMEAGSF